MLPEWPLLFPFTALAAGVYAAELTGFSPSLSAVAGVFICLTAAHFSVQRFLFPLLSLLFFCLLGAYTHMQCRTAVSTAALFPPVVPTEAVIEGTVRSRPAVTPDGARFTLRPYRVAVSGHDIAAAGDLMVSVSSGESAVARGDRIRFRCRLSRPSRLGLPGEFDYSRFLALRGISGTAVIREADHIVLMQPGSERNLLRSADTAALLVSERIRSVVSDDGAASILTALLIGDQKRIPRELAGAYRRAGVSHILSVSGFHIGIIALFLTTAILAVLVRCEILALSVNLRKWVPLLILPVMLFYLLLTGSEPATARSVIMMSVYVIVITLERETDPVNSLLMAATVLLAIDPPVLFDISFQLSFLALWGIMILLPPIADLCRSLDRPWLRLLLLSLATSCAASVVTAVPVLSAFGTFSLNGIIANLLIVPLLGYGAVIAGFCALPLMVLLPWGADRLFELTAQMIFIANRMIGWFARLPEIHYYRITPFDMCMFIGVMAAVTFIRHKRVRASLCMLLPGAAVCGHLLQPPDVDGRLHVYMLSVGQGESLVIRGPDGRTALIDGGGFLRDTGRDFGERYLAPALHTLGIRRIDHMILTHSHPDHTGGLPYVARNFPVGSFWESTYGGAGADYDNLRHALDDRDVACRHLAAGDTVRISDDVLLRVLSPSRDARASGDADHALDLNESSLVFRLEFRSFRMLFTADAGFPVEERLLASEVDIASSVLKVGHHGSRFSTSAAFLDRVRPQLALISAGRHNSFNLPADDTVALLEQRRVRVCRTDRDGTVEIVSDGSSWDALTRYKQEYY